MVFYLGLDSIVQRTALPLTRIKKVQRYIIMASKNQLTGMTGVYLVAAELSKQGFVVAPTSRSAQGADLLVTDVNCQRSFAVQVKTNAKTFGFWLLGAKAKEIVSDSLVYALVNLRKDGAEYYLVPSRVVSANVKVYEANNKRKNTWYQINRDKVEKFRDNWKIFETEPTRKRRAFKPLEGKSSNLQ